MVSKEIAGIRIDFEISYEDVLNKIDEFVKGGTHYIWTLNPEFVMDAQKDHEFRELLNESGLSIADGAGLNFARHYLEKVKGFKRGFIFPLKAFIYGVSFGFGSLFKSKDFGVRLTGADLIYKVCENAERNGQTVLLLGGWARNSFGKLLPQSGEIAKRAAKVLVNKYPRLKIVGASSEFKREPSDDANTLNFIHQKMSEEGISHIDIVLVAYNHIHQEKWIKRNLAKIPARVGIGIGASLDFIVGEQKRSPNTAIRKNLEWLYRLFTQPWRVGRILKAFPIFPLFVYILSVKDQKTS